MQIYHIYVNQPITAGQAAQLDDAIHQAAQDLGISIIVEFDPDEKAEAGDERQPQH